jgi:hypothetical protein
MDINIQTLIIIAIFIFIALMAFFAIILSLINWLHIRKSLRSLADIPKRLYLPLSPEEQILMRSWYINGGDPRSYIREIPNGSYPLPFNSRSPLYAGAIALPFVPCLPQPSSASPDPRGTCWRPLNSRAGRALKNPGDSVREAQTLTYQVTEAIRQFEEEPDSADAEEHPGSRFQE